MSDFAAAAPNPVTALLLFGVGVVLLALFTWPRLGLLARLRRATQLSDRVRLEDGLKHLFTFEAAVLRSSVDSLAGALGVSRSKAVGIVRRLESTDLVRLETDNIVLTEEGRAYALRIVRTHRLWERYLADRTSTSPTDWHAEADRVEHGLSELQVEDLAARMGYPLYDPHGDPIPTAAGVLPPLRGVPLTGLRPGESARVVHVEDEPEELYRTIRNAGIHLGTLLRLDAVEPTQIHLTVEGSEIVLEPFAARNIAVEVIADEVMDMGVERLHALHIGESGEVVRLGGGVQGAQRRRLLDLGVVPGTVIRAELSSVSGDPMAYRIRGAVIALRRSQADDILIRRVADAEAA